MSVSRFFIGWDKPLLDLASNYLEKTLSENPNGNSLIITPSKQASRKLQQLLDKGKTRQNNLLFGTPETALDIFLTYELSRATPNQQITAWALTLKNINFKKLKNIFPIPPKERSMNWALKTARAFISLKNSLSEGALNISDLTDNDDWSLGDSLRWIELSQLEQLVESKLQTKGLTHKLQAPFQPQPTDNEINNIILIGLPDPPKILTKILGTVSKNIDINIAIYAPHSEEKNFDHWGKPIKETWSKKLIDIPLTDSCIHVESTPKKEAEKISSIVSNYKDPLGLVGIIITDNEITSFLRDELHKNDFNTFDPSGQSLSNHEIFALINQIRNLLATKSFKSLCELIQFPGMVNIISTTGSDSLENSKLDALNEILIDLDQINNYHMPKDLDSCLRFTRNQEKFKKVYSFLNDLNMWILDFENNLQDHLLSFLKTIYSNQKFDSHLDRSYLDIAQKLNDLLHEIEPHGLNHLGAVDKLDFIIQSLKTERTHEIKEPHSIELQGWLEALWDNNPHITIAGMNEGYVPDRTDGDIFLPDKLRESIGLRCNESILARDNYIFTALLESRSIEGRVDITLGKKTIEGDNLKPSRLLLQCNDKDLAERALKLCTDSDSENKIPPWTYAWKLKPIKMDEQSKIFNQISVTDFRNYLSCPFRFYLKNIAKMPELEKFKMEMDPREFGTLCHEVLDDFGKNQEVNDSDNEEEIYSYLTEKLNYRVKRKYGTNPSVPILFQTSSINERLRWFSTLQAKQRSLGWKILHSEYVIHKNEPLMIGKLKLRGTIDRIEINERDGSFRVLDYKTTSHSKNPKSIHIKKTFQNQVNLETEWKYLKQKDKYFEWTDLQIPLYVYSSRKIFNPKEISTGYFNIGASKESTRIETWDEIDDDFLESALNCALGVSSSISNHIFWPPNDSPKYDSYSEIIFGDCSSNFEPIDN